MCRLALIQKVTNLVIDMVLHCVLGDPVAIPENETLNILELDGDSLKDSCAEMMASGEVDVVQVRVVHKNLSKEIIRQPF